MSKSYGAAVVLVVAMIVGGPAAEAAGYTTLSLPSLNTDIRTWTDGGSYSPLFPGTWTGNGVPFELAVDGQGHTVFMLGTLDIPVNVFGISTAYTMINSAFGTFGTLVGSIEFFGTNGAYHKVDLIEGINVRDHYAGSFNNVIDGVNAVPAFDNGPNRARLDMQIYTLPPVFHVETLQFIRFTGLDMGSGGQPFIAAATVMPVPEPGVGILVLSSVGVLLGTVRRLRRPSI